MARTGSLRLEDFVTQRSEKDGLLLSGRYRIAGLLGSGSTAEVYLAEDNESGAPVVVKWLHPHALRNAQIRLRFVHGARAAMAVNHPAVRRVFAVSQLEDQLPYVVMEALPGEPLSDYLEHGAPLATAEALALAREVALGLAAAHAAGIVHRDVKPGNLFLVQEPGASMHVKVIDFGFAKDTRDPDAGPPSTNLVLGTAQYMAPEQVVADPVDSRTDIYGFGVVLFRLVTGHLPFDLDTGADLFSHHLFSPTPPPSWLADDLDPRLERVVLRCMRKHPENRYPSMQAVIDDLDRIASGGEVVPVPLARDPDVYKPRNHSGREAAETLAEHFGAEPPPPATVRFDPESIRVRRGR
ncbi:MAG TPA: serine/threonine-protein kinase [Polyangiaceae bacterium]